MSLLYIALEVDLLPGGQYLNQEGSYPGDYRLRLERLDFLKTTDCPRQNFDLAFMRFISALMSLTRNTNNVLLWKGSGQILLRLHQGDGRGRNLDVGNPSVHSFGGVISIGYLVE